MPDIAIVGMSCRFPDAPHVPAFWRNNLAARVSLRELDNHRWDHERFYDPNIRTKNRTHTQTAGLVEDIDLFAARAFRVSPRMARAMDPQQRLAIELVREALQDAGLERRPFDRLGSGVFLGASISEYAGLSILKVRAEQLKSGQFGAFSEGDSCTKVSDVNSYTMAGGLTSMVASGVAHTFRLGGGALTVDSACASSLAALVQGCLHLNSLPPPEGESPVALVGGVYLMLNPENAVCFAKLGALARSECRPFDASAEGFILGEGGGVFVLKRLADAEADGDRIYATIKAAVWNNDAGSSTPMTPSQEGQARLLRHGFASSGLAPSDIGYLECHATATRAGDATELAALSEVWEGPHRPTLGSVKANIGHTLCAAGAAGLMRATLALFHRVLPPQAAWESWHPNLVEHSDRFQIRTEPRPWEGPEAATVSSFGFGGTNCFVVLEKASSAPEGTAEGPHSWGFFAPDSELMDKYLRACEEVVKGYTPVEVMNALRGRSVEDLAVFVRGASAEELLEALRQGREALGDGPSQGENFLAGPAAELQLEGWPEAKAWLDDAPSEASDAACLPPSPQQRQSFWNTERLPGPRTT